MIDPKELRIGNIVEKNGVEYVADFITIQMAHLYNPIIISHEILQEFGFNYNISKGISSFDNDSEDGDTFFWDLPVKQSDYSDSFTFSIVKWGDEGELTFSNHFLRIRIKYVHQLQNLYFSLAGKELSPKEHLPFV